MARRTLAIDVLTAYPAEMILVYKQNLLSKGKLLFARWRRRIRK